MSTTTYIRLENGHFQCPHCPKVCEKQNTMYYHMKKNHTDDFKFECKECDLKFVQKSAYLQHQAVKHPEVAEEVKEETGESNPFLGVSFECPCGECNHQAKTKANILVHFARTHCKDWIPVYVKTSGCKGCDKTFASSTAYYYHALSCVKPVPEEYAAMLSGLITAK